MNNSHSFVFSFIGELFKLQMLTAPIMYDCVDYLLRNKTDEESLECLCKLLRTMGKELDTKTPEKVLINIVSCLYYYFFLDTKSKKFGEKLC